MAGEAGLPRVRAPCNDVTCLRVLAARLARGLLENLALPSNRGRGECRVPNAPAAWCALKGSNMHTSLHSGGTGKHPAFPTQWFYGL